MAEIKKYLDQQALEALVGKIKSADAQVLADAKAHAEGLADNYDAAGMAATVQGKLDEEVARAKAKEDELVAKDVALQKEVDDLEVLVGTLPDDATATDVVGYVQEKTAGIATESALGELQDAVDLVEADVEAIKGDYLKAADKTELSDAITAEADRAKGVEGGFETRIKAIEDDYLVEADKTELQGKIDTVSGKVTTLVGEDADKSVRTIANEELAKQLIAEGAKESLDTLGEIAAWIQAHPEDASAMNKAIEDLEALVGTLPEGVTSTTIVGYVQEVVAAEKARAEEAEGDLAERIEALEGAVGSDGSVQDAIDAAIAQEVIDRNAAIAPVSEQADKGVADAAAALKAAQDAASSATSLNDAMDVRMKAVEGKAHEHANKAELDLIATGDKAKWDAAEAKAHEHANKGVIDGITAEKVTAWDTVSAKAESTALDAAVVRIAANESAIASFQPIAASDVEALFA